MILGTGCLGEETLSGPAIEGALAALGLDRVLLVVDPEATPSGLSGLHVAGVRCAWEDRDRGISVARTTRARRLVLDLPTDLDLLELCRALFELARVLPGLPLAVLTPPGGPAGHPEGLGHVLDDLSGDGIGWWHRPARAHRTGVPDQAAWIDQVGRHLVGMSLDDVLGEEEGLPPGTGELDLPALASLAGRALEVALDTGPLPDVGLLRVALRDLEAAGFP